MTERTEQRKSLLVTDQFVDGIIQFLEALFTEIPGYTWDPDPTNSEIVVENFDAFNLETVDKRPRITVELIEASWENVVIDRLQQLNLITHERIITDLAAGNVVLQCVSSNTVESKRIASIVWEAIRVYRDELRKVSGFFEIDSSSIGRTQRIKSTSATEVRATPVIVRLSVKKTYRKILNREKYEANSP
jgi:hypothetical protein